MHQHGVDALPFKIALSFVVSGIWIAFATILSEKLGSKLGGIVASLPSNIVVSLLFMGWAYGPLFASEAASVVPLAGISYLAFLFTFVLTAKKHGRLSFIFGFVAWLAIAVPIGLFGNKEVVAGTLAYMGATALFYFVAERNSGIRAVKGKPKTAHSFASIAFRAIFAGSVVATSIAVAYFAGPVWGGILTTLPASYFSTAFILANAGGFRLAAATMKTMLISSANIVAYAISVFITYPMIGLVWGTILSYLVSVLFVILAKPMVDKSR